MTFGLGCVESNIGSCELTVLYEQVFPNSSSITPTFSFRLLPFLVQTSDLNPFSVFVDGRLLDIAQSTLSSFILLSA
jgi:hypothetical protein